MRLPHEKDKTIPRCDIPTYRAPLDEVLRSSDTLVYTMTFACERVWEDDPGSVADLDQRLRSQRWRIFRRLRQQLYALHPDDQTKPWIREEIINHPDYDRWEHHYEFQQLIRAGVETFGDDLLTEDELRTIFDAIRRGPDREVFHRVAGDNDTDELFEQRRRNFHCMQLRPFEAVLFGEYRDYFQELESVIGANIADEDYLSAGPTRSGIITGAKPQVGGRPSRVGRRRAADLHQRLGRRAQRSGQLICGNHH